MLPDGQRSPLKRIDIFIPFVLILGIAIPVVLYAMIMVNIGWSAPILGANSAANLFSKSGTPVILYESESTRSHFAKIGGNYENLLKPWRNYFQDRKRNFKSISTNEQLSELKTGVLILPSALALSDPERSAIMAFREKGGSVLATWATGTRTNDGEWSGWQFLELIGAKHLGELEKDSPNRTIIFDGQTPLSNTLPAGQSYTMASTGENLLRIKGDYRAAQFANEQRVTANGEPREGAIIYSEAPGSNSRSAIFAFSENSWEARPLIVHQLIDDTLRWLNRDVVAQRAYWPEGKKAAQIISSDSTENLEQAVEIASKLQASAIPSTCFVSPTLAKESLKTTNLLSRVCEIAVLSKISSATDGKSAAPSIQEQLSSARSEINTVFASGGKAFGIKTLTELTAKTIEQPLVNSGYKYYVSALGRSETHLPEFTKTQIPDADLDLLNIPFAQASDAQLKPGLSAAQVKQLLAKDFEQLLNEGSLGWLNFATGAAGNKDESRQGFTQHWESLKQYRNSIWFTNASQVNDWWRMRERLKLDTAYNGKRLDLNLTVKGEQLFKGAALVVMLPKKNAVLAVSGTKVGTPIPTVVVLDEFRAQLKFTDLNPGNYSYQVTFSN